MKIKLAPMTEDDLDAVMEIERLSFPTCWSKKLFLNELENPNSSIILARDESGSIIGFACFWTIVDEVHILKIAVRPRFRRQGIAKRLLAYVLESSKGKGACCLFLEVRNRNHPAIAFYKGFGFIETGTRKGYYEDTGEDAVMMELELEA